MLAAIPALAQGDAPAARRTVRLSIEDAMRIVERTSHPLAAARAASDRAAADVVAARSYYFPQVNIAASYVRLIESEFTGLFGGAGMQMATGALPFTAPHIWRGDVNATQLIWDGGYTAGQVAAARGVKRVADLDVSARHAQAVYDVTDAYFAAVLAARLVAIGEASLTLAERTLAQTRAGFEQGTTAEFDVVRSEVTRDNQRTSLIRSRADRDTAFRRLRQLLGLPLDYPLELTTPLAVDEESTAGLGDVARTAARVQVRRERVGVAQARANVEIRRAQRRAASAGRWPTIRAATDYYRVDYPTHFFPDDDWRANFTVGVYLDFQLFTGFRTTAQIRGARADVRAAEAQFLEAFEQAQLDERRVESDLEVARATLAASHHSTELARRAYQIAEVRYQQGLSTYIELLDARISLDQAQINEASAARDLAVTRVRLALLPSLPVEVPSVTPRAVQNLVIAPPVAPTTAPTTRTTTATPTGTFTTPGERPPGSAR